MRERPRAVRVEQAHLPCLCDSGFAMHLLAAWRSLVRAPAWEPEAGGTDPPAPPMDTPGGGQDVSPRTNRSALGAITLAEGAA